MANKLYFTLGIAALACLGFSALISAQEKQATDLCLACICEAISGCNQTALSTGGVGGMFRITRAYWSDAGKLTIKGEAPTSESAYPNCVNDAYCAATTIRNYMTKFAQDCNGDSKVDCYDYAAIHKLGGCKGELSHQYLTTLNNCLSAYDNSGPQSLHLNLFYLKSLTP